MEIYDYLRALGTLPETELDEHFLQRSDTEIRFERVRAPNSNWRHAQGAIVNAPGRAEQNDSDEATYRAEMREFDEHVQSSRNHLPGFITDLRAAFGGNITISSITANKLDDNKPITARAVALVIEHAKLLRAKENSLPYEARMEAETRTRSTNAQVISSYIINSMWSGILFDGVPDPNDDRLPLAREIGRLGKASAQFVKTMVTELCKKHPKYSLDCFESPDFLAIANTILQEYDDIRHYPWMTPTILEATFAKANQNTATQGATLALAKLPVLAATTCLMCNLDPEIPNSLMCEAIARTLQNSPGSPIPEIALTRIREEFPARFKQVQKRTPIPPMTPPDQAYFTTINHGTELLDEMLSTFRKQSRAITASPDFTPRQKTALSLWHGGGIINADILSDAKHISKKTQQVLASMFAAAQDKDFPANLICDELDYFANTLIKLANASIQKFRDEHPTTPEDDGQIDQLLNTYCESLIPVGVFGFHQEDVARLLDLLNGEIGEALDQLLQQGPSLPATIYARLTDACRQRADEIDDRWHVILESELNDSLAAEISAEEADGESAVILPDGNTIGNKFCALAMYSAVTVHWQDGRAILDPTDWKLLDNRSKLEQIQSLYAELIDSVFDGNAGRAALFTQQATAQVSATYSLWDTDPAQTPLQLPDGTPFNHWSHCTETLDITLIEKKWGQLTYETRQQVISPRSAIGRDESIHWLDPKQSGFEYSCRFIMTRDGNIIVAAPIRMLSLNITPNGWPKQDYPEPIPDDLSDPEYSAHDDLLDYVVSTENPHHLQAVVALDALGAFRNAPSFEQALSIYEQYLASGALNWLGDPIAIAFPGLLKVARHFDVQPAVNALRPIVAMLEFAEDDPNYAIAEESIVALRHQIDDFIANPTISKLDTIDDKLHAAISKYPGVQHLIPEDLVARFAESMQAIKTLIDAAAFEPLEHAVIDFIGRVILPDFIEWVRAEFEPETTAHT